jgi:hypothetical protein
MSELRPRVKGGMRIDYDMLLNVLGEIADSYYDGGLIVLRLKKNDWRVAFGSLDDWGIDQMPSGKSFYGAAKAAHKKHEKELLQEITDKIIKPVLQEMEGC